MPKRPRWVWLGGLLCLCSCRERAEPPAQQASSARAARDAATLDGASDASLAPPAAPAETVRAWATWPMPNSSPGLPNPQSFDTSSPGTVLDRVTQLMWQRGLDGSDVTLAEARQKCHSLTLAGYSDWRLPSRIELVSILDSTRTQPSINSSIFPGTPSDWFWSESPAAGDSNSAWYVYFYFGYPKTDLTSNQFAVRCVRGGMPPPAPDAHYEIGADTVRDRFTGLTWQRAVPAQTSTFAGAQTYCGALTLDGKKRWRAPSLAELLTLVDERAPSAPAIDTDAFPNTPSEAFWSSTGFGGSAGLAWQVYFDRGAALYGLPSAQFHVRCVQ